MTNHHEDLRPYSVLFAGERRREAVSSREDRLHRQARDTLSTRSHCSWREDETESKRALACLHDSFSSCIADGAIPRTVESSRSRRNPGTGTAGCDRVSRSLSARLESIKGRAHAACAGSGILSLALSRSVRAKERKASWENGDAPGNEAFPRVRSQTLQSTRRHGRCIRPAGARAA